VTKYLLDTDTCIFGLRDHPGVMSRLSSMSSFDWGISSLTAFEILRGVSRVGNQRTMEESQDFVNFAQVFPFQAVEANRAAQVERELARLGRPAGQIDMMIAGHALSLGLTLVTNNKKHFDRISGLRLDNWL
jgi:tRNA(fMet)-specific endonuclease VapC